MHFAYSILLRIDAFCDVERKIQKKVLKKL